MSAGDPQNTQAGSGGDEERTGWTGYVPGQVRSSPMHELRHQRRLRMLVGVVVLVGLAAVAATVVVVSRSGTTAVAACTPAPCADDGAGLRVYVDSARILPGSSLPAETGNVVQVSLRFTNVGQAARTVNALDFTLRDSTGEAHGLLQVAGQACGVFEAVQLAPGMSLGPKVLCFSTPASPGTQPTLVWSPNTHAIDIPVTVR